MQETLKIFMFFLEIHKKMICVYIHIHIPKQYYVTQSLWLHLNVNLQKIQMFQNIVKKVQTDIQEAVKPRITIVFIEIHKKVIYKCYSNFMSRN